MCWCDICEKGCHRVQGRIPLHAKNGVFGLRTREPEETSPTGFQLAGGPSKGLSTWLRKPGPPVRPLKEQLLGTVDQLGTSNPGVEASRDAPGAPSVLARCMEDSNLGDEVAQRGASDVESISGDEIREPRRRSCPSDHVLTGRASFRSWCVAFVQGRGRAERRQSEGRKELKDG